MLVLPSSTLQPILSRYRSLFKLVFNAASSSGKCVSGVLCGNGLNQYDPAFFNSHWVMHSPSRDDVKIAGGQINGFSFVFYTKRTLHNIEQLVLFVMFVPDQ